MYEAYHPAALSTAGPWSHTSVPQLRDTILAYVAAHNDNPKPFRWTKTANEILDKLRRFGTRTLQVHGS